MKLIFRATLFVLLGFPLCVIADTTVALPKGAPSLSISFPDTWKVKGDSADAQEVIVTSPDGSIELNLKALKSHSDPKKTMEQLEETAKGIAEEINEYVKDFKVEESKRGNINGIDAAMFGGTGKSKEDGSEVNVEVTYLTPDNKQVFSLVYWGSEEAEAANKADLAKISSSLKKG